MFAQSVPQRNSRFTYRCRNQEHDPFGGRRPSDHGRRTSRRISSFSGKGSKGKLLWRLRHLRRTAFSNCHTSGQTPDTHVFGRCPHGTRPRRRSCKHFGRRRIVRFNFEWCETGHSVALRLRPAFRSNRIVYALTVSTNGRCRESCRRRKKCEHNLSLGYLAAVE